MRSTISWVVALIGSRACARLATSAIVGLEVTRSISINAYSDIDTPAAAARTRSSR